MLWRRASSCGLTGTSAIAPRRPLVQLALPVLQARPRLVSSSALSQMAVSRRGSSVRSSVRSSCGSACQAAWLAPKMASPQVMGMG